MCATGWLYDAWHWWTAARLAATAAVTGAVMAVVTGSTAVRTLRHNRRATRATTRPMMVAYLTLSAKLRMGLVVTNVGSSIARDVEIEFDPPLPTHDQRPDGKPSLLPPIRRRYSKSVAVWVPGFVAYNEYLIGTGSDSDGAYDNVEGVPSTTSVLFNYKDDDNNAYRDRMLLDPALNAGETWMVRRTNGVVTHDGSPWLRSG